jgi:hypothetical protein
MIASGPSNARAYSDRQRHLDHRSRFAVFVAQLHQRRSALGDPAGKAGRIVAARALRIDDGIQARVDRHQHTLVR